MRSRSGWSAGVEVFDAAPRDTAEPLGEKPFSYLESPGYCATVLAQAQRALKRPKDTDFSDIFEHHAHNDRTEAYLASLNANERGALKEISATSTDVLLKLKIVTRSNIPAESSPAWTAE